MLHCSITICFSCSRSFSSVIFPAGHLFAFGADRRAAIANMVIALRAVHIRGEIHTNVDYTTDLIQDKEYVGNEIHTGWLDSRIARRIKAQRPPWHICVVTGALYVSGYVDAIDTCTGRCKRMTKKVAGAVTLLFHVCGYRCTPHEQITKVPSSRGQCW